MTRRLMLRRYAVENANYALFGAHRIRIEALNAENMDPYVFLYRRSPLDPNTGEAKDTFLAVASPVDMEEYPIEDPDPNKGTQFFRKSVVELDFRSTSLADEVWGIIKAEVCQLIEALNRLENLQAVEDFWCNPPSDSESTSSASSDSFSVSTSVSV